MSKTQKLLRRMFLLSVWWLCLLAVFWQFIVPQAYNLILKHKTIERKAKKKIVKKKNYSLFLFCSTTCKAKKITNNRLNRPDPNKKLRLSLMLSALFVTLLLFYLFIAAAYYAASPQCRLNSFCGTQTCCCDNNLFMMP